MVFSYTVDNRNYVSAIEHGAIPDMEFFKQNMPQDYKGGKELVDLLEKMFNKDFSKRPTPEEILEIVKLVYTPNKEVLFGDFESSLKFSSKIAVRAVMDKPVTQPNVQLKFRQYVKRGKNALSKSVSPSIIERRPSVSNLFADLTLNTGDFQSAVGELFPGISDIVVTQREEMSPLKKERSDSGFAMPFMTPVKKTKK